jgi:hypothetical protein
MVGKELPFPHSLWIFGLQVISLEIFVFLSLK